MLKYLLAKYILLISDFVEKKISAGEFERRYLRMVKDQTYKFDDDAYQVMQSLFEDVDEYVPNDLYNPNNPYHEIGKRSH